MRKLWKCMKNHIALLGIMAFCGMLLCACGSDQKPEKTGDVSYEIVPEAELPEELAKLIDERKESEFRLSFSDEESLYLIVGYGRQQTGGYSIQIKDLYLADDVIYIDTELQGPLPEETANAEESTQTPYIVVKMEMTDKTIYFE